MLPRIFANGNGTNASTPAGPLTPFLQPLLAFEAPFNTFFKPFVTPFGVDAEGPMAALNDLTAGSTPEFVKAFQNIPNLFAPPTNGGGTGETAAQRRQRLINEARTTALRNRGRGGGTAGASRARPYGQRSVG